MVSSKKAFQTLSKNKERILRAGYMNLLGYCVGGPGQFRLAQEAYAILRARFASESFRSDYLSWFISEIIAVLNNLMIVHFHSYFLFR